MLRNAGSGVAAPPQNDLSKQGLKRKTGGTAPPTSDQTSGPTPGWMHDFDDPSRSKNPPKHPEDSTKPAPSSKPEWLKDFE
jgi:hypothetical protein